jgi:hypothetical protein
MPDDYIDLKNQQDEEPKPQETAEVTSWWIGRWAHVIAIFFFCVVYFPLSDHGWSWQAAVTVSYVVFLLCCTCGLSFQDSDDFFGSPEVIRYIGILLVRQILIIALISLGAYLWRYLIPLLPRWSNERAYRNLSLWEVGGALLVYFVAIKEATWMAKKIKQRFPDIKEPLDFIRSEESS